MCPKKLSTSVGAVGSAVVLGDGHHRQINCRSWSWPGRLSDTSIGRSGHQLIRRTSEQLVNLSWASSAWSKMTALGGDLR